MISRQLCVSLFCVLTACATIASGEANDAEDIQFTNAVGIRGGSLGWGVELKTRVQDPLDLRIVWQTLEPGSFDVDSVTDDVLAPQPLANYHAAGRFRSGGLIADWYPWESPIRFSFGILKNFSQFELVETTANLDRPANTYTADFGKLAYFFGTGWAPRFSSHRFSLTLDAGLLAQQPAQVLWFDDNVPRSDAEQAFVWRERQEIKQELDSYKILPVLMIGFSAQL